MIPPGGEGRITIVMDSRKCSGAVKKTAIVKTNDPKNAHVWLDLLWRF